ncbi:hypothetical protein, partial [Candidatus Liberibacter asiaticus]|uniref:hypothetical protein n=1 Tax=Liberibacter asiaticus TaxID=34021 RepID=UPI001AED3A92
IFSSRIRIPYKVSLYFAVNERATFKQGEYVASPPLLLVLCLHFNIFYLEQDTFNKYLSDSMPFLNNS